MVGRPSHASFDPAQDVTPLAVISPSEPRWFNTTYDVLLNKHKPHKLNPDWRESFCVDWNCGPKAKLGQKTGVPVPKYYCLSFPKNKFLLLRGA